jgi:hypothetical protein
MREDVAHDAGQPLPAVLLRTRPPEGLLGSMAEPPTSEWRADYDPAQALLDSRPARGVKRMPSGAGVPAPTRARKTVSSSGKCVKTASRPSRCPAR